MQVRRVYLKNFRCFTEFDVAINQSLVLITGANGSGKTSILEALHYAGYMRSFRTYLPKEIVKFEQDTFFIKIDFQDTLNNMFDHELQIGFSGKKKSVKIDKKSISSYKELTNFYRTVTLTEDDLMLIKGTPDVRRAFLDQAVVLISPEFLSSLRAYKQTLLNRNALLQKKPFNETSYDIWTQQLWQQARIIQEKRKETLTILEASINQMLDAYFDKEIKVGLKYQQKMRLEESYQSFRNLHGQLCTQETAFARSLFGAHLDDMVIQFEGKKSKKFASRGQQKLSLVLLKIAVLQELQQKQGPAVFLLDDFMTDFDPSIAHTLMNILAELPGQRIFTSPLQEGPLENLLKKRGAQHYHLGS